jgi:hypothetical protein
MCVYILIVRNTDAMLLKAESLSIRIRTSPSDLVRHKIDVDRTGIEPGHSLSEAAA